LGHGRTPRATARADPADLRSCDFAEAGLSQACLTNAILIGADMKDTTMTRADLRDANITRADFRGARDLQIN